MKRRVCSLLVTVLALLFFCSPLQALSDSPVDSSDRMQLALEQARAFLDQVIPEKQILNSKILKNFDETEETVVYSLDSSGYLIVNLNDFSIPEFSPTAQNPFVDRVNGYYNGPFEYYEKKDGKFLILKKGYEIRKEEISHVYHRDTISIGTFYNRRKLRVANATPETGRLSGALQPWVTQNDNCGSVAAAICMRFFHDYVNRSYLPENQLSYANALSYVQQFVKSGRTTMYDLTSGINKYFSSKSISNSVSSASTTYNSVRYQIKRNRPTIIYLSTHPKYGTHWVTSHGYSRVNTGGEGDSDYIVVNDGWGSNDVWISANHSSIGNMIVFAQ